MYENNPNEFDQESQNLVPRDSLVHLSPKIFQIQFIRKVYGILSAQLLLTTLVCGLATLSSSFQSFLDKNIWIIIVSCVLYFITMIMLFCYSSIRRAVPWNYILLFVFTLSMAFIIAYVCAKTNPKIVFMAAALTVGIVVALTFYAIVTKTDFTMLGGVLAMCSILLLLFCIFLFFTNNKVLHIIYCSLCVLLFGIYLIFDTQLVIGGRKHQIGLDDYILGSLILYIDIVSIFYYLLLILRS